MEKLLLLILPTLFAIMPCAFSQQAKPNESAATIVPKEEQATREDVIALMDVLHSRAQMVAGIEMMKQQMISGMRSGFLNEHPNASPKVLDKFAATMDGVWQVINIEELVSAVIPVYQKYLSHDDAISLISFYSSSAGQHYLSRMPDLIKESGETGGNVMKGHMDEVQHQAKLKFQEFEKYIAAHPEELGAPAKTTGENQ